MYFGTLGYYVYKKSMLPSTCFSIQSSPATVGLYEGVSSFLQNLDGCFWSIRVGAVKGWTGRDVIDVQCGH